MIFNSAVGCGFHHFPFQKFVQLITNKKMEQTRKKALNFFLLALLHPDFDNEMSVKVTETKKKKMTLMTTFYGK